MFRIPLFLALVLSASALANAQVTLLIEEPINLLGHLTSTGHAALLLENVCSSDYLSVRPCKTGETGTVISRYQGIGNHDWLAVPPAPYLYALNDDNHLPDSVTRFQVDALRENYRAAHLQHIAPQGSDDNWIQLVGTSYRRRVYAIRVTATPQQEARLITWLNRRSNRSHFNLIFNNCADFLRQALNVLYPGAVRRSFIFDAGITTPKQLAYRLHRYATHHPDVHFEVSLIPQVPGELPRSGRAYGITESFAKTKPYLYPLGILQPIGIGTVVAVGVADRRYDVHREGDQAPVLDLDPPTRPTDRGN